MVIKQFAISGLLSLLVPCMAFGDPIKIGSVKTALYSKSPQRLFVMTDFGSSFGPSLGESFQRQFTLVARDCNVAVDMSLRTPLDLDENVHSIKVKKFDPDTILYLSRHGGTVDVNGQQIHAIYNAKLVDAESANVTWEAIINFPRNSKLIPIAQRGEALAIELTNAMKKNEILLNCPMLKSEP